jgi:DNA invertase Pin-like site-specific DNA recombinase
VGYARVSTDEQNLDLQLRALHQAGCENIFTDQGWSGCRFDRPGLDEVLTSLQSGDTLVVWRLDRLGRSIGGLIDFVEQLGKRSVEFRSLNESIDTTSSGGRLVFHIMAALAEFERTLVSERTKAGLEAARGRGARLGRPPSLTEDCLTEARRCLAMGLSRDQVASKLQITPRTLRRYLNENPAECVPAPAAFRS